MSKIILSCLDRDGTINVDTDDSFLGKDSNWREQLRFMPYIPEAMQRLQKAFPNLQHHIISNQAGIAINSSGFEALTEERVEEVNQEIVGRLAHAGVRVHSCRVCPYVDSKYAEKSRAKGRSIDPNYIKDDCPNRKPQPGMIFDIMEEQSLYSHDCKIIVFGDRLTDVETGVNAGGFGILIPSAKTRERNDIENFKKRRAENTYFFSRTRYAEDAMRAAEEAIALLTERN